MGNCMSRYRRRNRYRAEQHSAETRERASGANQNLIESGNIPLEERPSNSNNIAVVYTADQSSALTKYMIDLQQEEKQAVPIYCKDRECLLKISPSQCSRMDLLACGSLYEVLMEDGVLHQDVHAKFKEFERSNRLIYVIDICCHGNKEFEAFFQQIPRNVRRIEGDQYTGNGLGENASAQDTTGMKGGSADNSNVVGDAHAGRNIIIGNNNSILIEEKYEATKGSQDFDFKKAESGRVTGNTTTIDPDTIQLTVHFSKEVKENVISEIIPTLSRSEGVRNVAVKFGSIIITLTLKSQFIITEEWIHNILRSLFSGQLASCISEGETFSVTIQRYIVYEVNPEFGRLQRRIELLEKENTNMERLILLHSSMDRKWKMSHLFREMETLKILDTILVGVLQTQLSPSLAADVLTTKQKSAVAVTAVGGLQDDMEFGSRVLERLRLGLQERTDLFPVLGDMMKHVKVQLSYMSVKTDFLELATSDKQMAGSKQQQVQLSVKQLYEHDRPPTDVHAKTRLPEIQNTTRDTSVKVGGSSGVPHTADDTLDPEKGGELKNRLEILEQEADNKQKELRELTDAPDSLVEWKYNMECLSLEMSTLRIQHVITDVIGDEVLPVITETHKNLPPARAPPKHNRRSGINQLRDFQCGKLQEGQLIDFVRYMTTDDQQRLNYLRTRSDQLERNYGCPIHIVGEMETVRSGPMSCPAMTLSRERVREDLAVAGEAGQFLTNTERSSGTDHRPDQFKIYRGTCSAPLPLPESPYTRTVPRYWETNSRVQGKERGPGWLLQMAVTEEVDRWIWVSVVGLGWSVVVRDCVEHTGCYCIDVWGNGSRVGVCLSTIPSPTHGNDVEIRLGIVLDVGRGRLAFIDVNREKVLHKFDVTFRQPPFPVFGVLQPPSNYAINMQLVSGGEIAITDSKKRLIAEALFSS